jgi:HlyD family secretion protein
VKSEPIVQTRARPKGEKRPSNLSLWFFVGVVLVVLIVIPIVVLRPREGSYLLRTFETAVVQRGTLIDYVRGSGSVTPRLERSLIAPAEGVLAEWLVAEGDEVAADAPLGRMTSRALEQELTDAERELQALSLSLEKLELDQQSARSSATRELAQAQQALPPAESELAVTRRLFEAGAASQHELEAAEAKLEQARAQFEAQRAALDNLTRAQALEREELELRLQQAERRLALAQERQTGLELRAPVSGRVMQLAADVGASVQSGALLATVASAEDVRVIVDIPEASAARVSVAQPARVRVAAQDYAASVVQVAPSARSTQGGPVVAVTLSFDSAPEGLRLGASASAEIEVGRQEEVLFLPRGPFLSTGGERFVYLVAGDRAVRTNVVFGLVDGNRIEVRDGLSLGDRIITSSYEAFRDRLEIRLAPEGDIRSN